MKTFFIALALSLAPASHASVVEKEEVAADGSVALSHSVVVPADAASVWQAISTPEGWKSWAVPWVWRSPDDASLWETSYNATAQPGDATNIVHRFTVDEAERSVRFRTIKPPAGFPHAQALSRVKHRFELSPEGSNTRVTLIGSGYGNDADSIALRAFFKSGNRASLLWLRKRFETGPSTGGIGPEIP